MDIVDEVFLWGGLAIAVTVFLVIFSPGFLQFLTGWSIDKQTGLKKRFFKWGNQDD
ncbi:MAG: hypothetical protein OEL53_10505 [Rhodospirillales bacterium]|nr:hypothetical protein [Rhodospirillales bacterium]